jgi:hypothetical protein
MKKRNKLRLNKEALRTLGQHDAERAAGGTYQDTGCNTCNQGTCLGCLTDQYGGTCVNCQTQPGICTGTYEQSVCQSCEASCNGWTCWDTCWDYCTGVDTCYATCGNGDTCYPGCG